MGDMSEYKLVPVEPTRYMEWAAENYWNERRFKWLSDDPRTWAGVYQAMLAAAPDMQQTTSDVSVLVDALELISDTDPNDGTAWFHEVAYKALAAHRKGEEV